MGWGGKGGGGVVLRKCGYKEGKGYTELLDQGMEQWIVGFLEAQENNASIKYFISLFHFPHVTLL